MAAELAEAAGRERRRPRTADDGPMRSRAAVRALQGPPARPAPGGDRHGGHPGRHPGAVLDLPRQHARPEDHPHGQGRPGRLEAPPAGVGRRPRLRLRRQPRLPDPRRRPLHRRREAAQRQRRGRGGAVPPGPLPHVAGNLRVKEVRVPGEDGARAERFVVCHNPEQAERDQLVRERLVAYLQAQIEGTDAWTKSKRDELAGRTARQAGAPAARAPHPGTGGSASTRPPSAGRPASTASGCCAPMTTRSPRGSGPRLQAAPRSRARLAGHEGRARGSVRSSTIGRTGSAATSSCAGSPCCSSGSSRTPPATPGATSATSSTACTWSPWRPPTAGSPSDRHHHRPAGRSAGAEPARTTQFFDFTVETGTGP